MARLICQSACRKFLLDTAKRTRTHEFKRVAPSVYDDLEASLREKMRAIVASQPSVGMTIK